jgi:hypothetical protein
MGLRIGQLTVDSRDPVALGSWWKEVLGFEVVFQDDEATEFEIAAPGGGWNILFGKAPDEKTVKNRLHLDLRPDDQAAEVARLKSLGATEVDIGQKDVSWVVMADPEGNEFCILRPAPQA